MNRSRWLWMSNKFAFSSALVPPRVSLFWITKSNQMVNLPNAAVVFLGIWRWCFHANRHKNQCNYPTWKRRSGVVHASSRMIVPPVLLHLLASILRRVRVINIKNCTRGRIDIRWRWFHLISQDRWLYIYASLGRERSTKERNSSNASLIAVSHVSMNRSTLASRWTTGSSLVIMFYFTVVENSQHFNWRWISQD